MALPDQQLQDRQLVTLIGWLVPLITVFAVFYSGLGLVFRDWPTIISGSVIALDGRILLLGARRLRQGHAVNAVTLIGTRSLLSVAALAALQPALHETFALVPVLVAIVLLNYTTSQTRAQRAGLIGCGVAAVSIVIIGHTITTPSSLPHGVK